MAHVNSSDHNHGGVGYTEQQNDNMVQAQYEQLTGARQEAAGTKHINFGYFFQLLLVSCLGIMQFGLCISAWNVQSTCFKLISQKEQDDPSEYEGNNTDYIQWGVTIGMVFGSFAAGPLSQYGRWFGVILMGIFSLIGGGLSLFYTNYYMVMAGKFLTGVAAGGYNVFCPKYIMECAPKEISGPAGAAFQLAVTFGIFINAIIAVPFGEITIVEEKSKLVNIYFLLQIIPMCMAVLQILLMCTCYRSDTPPVMIKKGKEEETRSFFSKMYNDDNIREDRLSELRQQVNGDADQGEAAEITYGQALCGDQYKLSSFVAISLAAFQQLTGINVVMFYSSKIFETKAGETPDPNAMTTVWINFWVYGVNFVAVIGAILLLARVGRRPIMIICNIGQAVMVILLGIFLIQGNKNLCFICTLTFLVLFEFSSGPVVWLYIAEIACDKAASSATVVNQIFNLSMAIIPTYAANAENGIAYMFIALGAATAVGTVFTICFMKETRGKTPAQIEEMFATGAARNQGYRNQGGF